MKRNDVMYQYVRVHANRAAQKLRGGACSAYHLTGSKTKDSASSGKAISKVEEVSCDREFSFQPRFKNV